VDNYVGSIIIVKPPILMRGFLFPQQNICYPDFLSASPADACLANPVSEPALFQDSYPTELLTGLAFRDIHY